MCYQVETTIKEKNLGQRVPGLRTGGGNIGIEVGTTQSSWESVSQGSPHGSSVTSTTSICGEAAPRRRPQNQSEENWLLTYRKCGLDESPPIQALVSSPVQWANTYLGETAQGIRWDHV